MTHKTLSMNKLVLNKAIRLKLSLILLSLMLLNVSALMFQHCGQLQMALNKRFLEPDTSASIETELDLYLDGENATSNPSLTAYTNQFINLTVNYKEKITKNFIGGAIVDVNGSGISEVLVEHYNNYTIMLNTSILPIGANFLTVYARKDGYEPQPKVITVQVIQIETELKLYLNGDDKTNDSIIEIPITDMLNITVKYTDNQTRLPITNAMLQLIGQGSTFNLTEDTILGQYYILLDTTDLDLGIYNFMIVAESENYQTQSINFAIKLTVIPTKLQIFLNNTDKTSDPFIELAIRDVLNVTVKYTDNQTGFPIANATIQLLTDGFTFNFTDNIELGQYYFLLDTTDLQFGINTIAIIAEKENYTTQIISFQIYLTARPSTLQLFLNNTDKTSDPFIELTITEMLNITVKYTDNQTGLPIANATVQLLVNGLTFNFTEGTELGQYYFLLDTTDLDLGINFLPIVAHAQNYASTIIYLQVAINLIFGTINLEGGGDQIEVYAGSDVSLKIILKDPQDNTIKGATVAYNWIYGQGELEDLDNDGIYIATFFNVQEGVHNITISAHAGIKYYFRQYVITLNVYTPPPLILYSNASTPNTDGSFFLIWTSFYGVNNFSVYQSYYYITEINESEILLADEITDLNLDLNGYSDGTYYFIVVAHGNYGDVISNCIKIDVDITSSNHPPQIIPSYDMALLLGTICMMGFYITRSKRIQKSLLR